jgi:Insertion element 4 transposase N-terminal/Transposase DDE domain
MSRGQCILPADASGRVLDRIAGLTQVIRTEDLRQALAATGRVDSRSCLLTHEVVLWIVLAMGIFTEVPIRQVFKLCRRFRPGERSPHRSSLCVARRRLGVAPVRHLFERIARPLAKPETPGSFYRGMRLMGIDGTVLNVPDSDANAAAFGRPSGPFGVGAFPQIRKLSLVELGTHVEIGMVFKAIRCGERSMVGALLRHLDPEMLLLLDQGFFSNDLWRDLVKRGVNVLARTTTQMILCPIHALPDGSYLAKIYKGEYNRNKDREGVVVRVIRYTLDDPQRVGHGEVHVLITNLLDETLYPARELIELYHERWEHEITFDEQKTHQDPRRSGKPAHLRSETPAGVIQELYALSIAHFVIRSLMFEAAGTTGLDPDRLSFSGCFQILKCRLPECAGEPDVKFQRWYEGILREMNQERTEPRRNRINPRVIKQPRSKWKSKKPAHRHLPPLKKTFMETVVMIR